MPSHVQKALDKALAEDIKERFRDANEFLVALNETKSTPVKVKSDGNSPLAKDDRPVPVRRKKSKGGFADIIGMEKLKETLELDILGPLEDKETYEKYGITAPNGMLLYGPPGCGKTFISKKLADEVSSAFLEVKPSDLASPYVHGGKDLSLIHI